MERRNTPFPIWEGKKALSSPRLASATTAMGMDIARPYRIRFIELCVLKGKIG